MHNLTRSLFIAAFLNAVAWIILIPLWQYPDEQAHFAQVQDVAQIGHVPFSLNTSEEIAQSEKILQTERDEAGNNKYTYHPEFNIEYSNTTEGLREQELIQIPKSARSNLVKNEATQNPPMYYFVASKVYELFSEANLITRVFALRLYSAVLYLLIVFFAYKIGKLIFKNKLFPYMLSAMVAFMPMFVYSTTGVLPDPLTNLLFTVMLYLLVKTLNEGFQKKYLLSMAAVFIAGVMTRQNFLISSLIVALTVLITLAKAKKLPLFFALCLIAFGFLYLTGLLGTSVPFISHFRIPDATNINIRSLLQPEFTQHMAWSAKRTFAEILPWYWGVYRWLSLSLPPSYYQIINRLTLLAAFGLLVYFIKAVKARKFSKELLIVVFMIVSNAAYYLALTIWDYFFRSHSGFSFGFQGRYFFPLIVFQMALLLTGFREVVKMVFGKYSKYLLFLLVVLFVTANNYSLFYVAGSYYDSSNINSFVIQASQYKPALVKGNMILVILAGGVLSQLIFLFSLGLATLRDKYESN